MQDKSQWTFTKVIYNHASQTKSAKLNPSKLISNF